MSGVGRQRQNRATLSEGNDAFSKLKTSHASPLLCRGNDARLLDFRRTLVEHRG